MRAWQYLILSAVVLCGLAVSVGAVTGSDRSMANQLHRLLDRER